MSSYLKSLDSNHLVSVGDEGFLDADGEHWAYRANDGVDHAALTALPNVDFGTFHLYPEDWGTPPGFAERWITDHLRVARALGKPTVLEEYGVKAPRAARLRTYRRWNELLLERGGTAALPWMLAADDATGPYPDFDGFAFYADDAVGKLIAHYAERFADAPACRAPGENRASPSPFVRVRR
jgi:mannan endo-1,4-beta-mannosidase